MTASVVCVSIGTVLCPLTGTDHRLFWMRSAWWCHDCRQKIESCCEGGGCPSIAEVALPQPAPDGAGAAR
ncbi:hypothetical protein Q5424_10270 [Conexibacter sp. JD483]|uniref:hypothetical protein n=1 Tax=unclassified Conexibacter TaxID=2627773 RepID=UPI00271CFE58|nr:MULTISPECIES: hypothetical protein [unclassified Conexibacter]MDO8189161.1 hypothetical protein [Conexibacter sp. CPCC 205706]MDO8200742.1 hypothetical protein [Conexibacter sp. CPCC 205762]MDR9369466.1 hypothetical protein [Conexibacter sp. JD483]